MKATMPSQISFIGIMVTTSRGMREIRPQDTIPPMPRGWNRPKINVRDELSRPINTILYARGHAEGTRATGCGDSSVPGGAPPIAGDGPGRDGSSEGCLPVSDRAPRRRGRAESGDRAGTPDESRNGGPLASAVLGAADSRPRTGRSPSRSASRYSSFVHPGARASHARTQRPRRRSVDGPKSRARDGGQQDHGAPCLASPPDSSSRFGELGAPSALRVRGPCHGFRGIVLESSRNARWHSASMRMVAALPWTGESATPCAPSGSGIGGRSSSRFCNPWIGKRPRNSSSISSSTPCWPPLRRRCSDGSSGIRDFTSTSYLPTPRGPIRSTDGSASSPRSGFGRRRSRV